MSNVNVAAKERPPAISPFAPTTTGNVAKSNWFIGFHFAYLESGEETKLTGLKAIKNRETGLYVYTGWNLTVQDSLFSENSNFGLDFRWLDNVQVSDSIVRGYTPETKALILPPHFNKPCVGHYFKSPIGYKSMVHIHQWNSKDNIGATFNNVLFSDFDHSDGCAPSSPIGFNTDDMHWSYSKHFTYLTMFNNVTIDGSKIMDADHANLEREVRDIVIHDIDGSSNPSRLGLDINSSSEQISQPGMWVSNVRWLKAFSGQTCENYPVGVSYCPKR